MQFMPFRFNQGGLEEIMRQANSVKTESVLTEFALVGLDDAGWCGAVSQPRFQRRHRIQVALIDAIGPPGINHRQAMVTAVRRRRGIAALKPWPRGVDPTPYLRDNLPAEIHRINPC